MRLSRHFLPGSNGAPPSSRNGGPPTTVVPHAGVDPVEDLGAGRPNAIVANARREFASAFGDLARGKRNWQIVAFVLAALALVQAITSFRLATAAQAIPYVVQVDRLGAVAAVGPAEPLRDPDARFVASQLAEFVRSVRMILPTAAANAQADLLRRAYGFVTPEAAGFLNGYLGDPQHDPRLLGARLTRDVRVTGALRVPDAAGSRRVAGAGQTWRVQWIETDTPREAGDSVRVAAWEGYLTLHVVPPRTADVIQENPLGLRITSISWTRVTSQLLPGTPDSLVRPALVGGTP